MKRTSFIRADTLFDRGVLYLDEDLEVCVDYVSLQYYLKETEEFLNPEVVMEFINNLIIEERCRRQW